jgi:hypothetical protein
MRTNSRPVALAIDLPSEVLPTPGGPTRHRIGPFSLFVRALHGEIFEDALLDLLEAVVVGVEHLLGGDFRSFLTFLLLAPRQRQQPVEIVAHHGRFRRHRRHLAQLLQLGSALVAGFLGELGLLDALFELGSSSRPSSPSPSSFWIAFICSFR